MTIADTAEGMCMSLRDYFAAHALAGLLANQELLLIVDKSNAIATTRNAAAQYAYALADSMLSERDK